MNRLRRILLLLAVVIVAGCSPAVIAPTVTPPPPPTATVTLTPLPTLTPTPTATPLPTPTPTPTPAPDFWDVRLSTPEAQGIDSETLVGMLDYVEQQHLWVHSILIVRNGYLVAEVYFYPFRQNRLHDLYSCTKSFTSALIGIAIEEGPIDSLDQKVLDFFPERTFANDGPRKRAMTLEHLLTMTAGLDWPESSISYSSSDNILSQMFRSPDWIQFILDRPMVAEPGTTFNYNTGVSHLLSAILEKATGMSTADFARAHLFAPLGITSAPWSSDPDGVTFGGGGLHLKPRDMARFGALYLQGGVWDGQQVVPADWAEKSVAASHYGYQWWMLNGGGYAALGYQGQRIVVKPDLEMVVVITGAFSGDMSRFLVDNFIVPAARSAEPLPENPEALALLETRISEVASPRR